MFIHIYMCIYLYKNICLNVNVNVYYICTYVVGIIMTIYVESVIGKFKEAVDLIHLSL